MAEILGEGTFNVSANFDEMRRRMDEAEKYEKAKLAAMAADAALYEKGLSRLGDSIQTSFLAPTLQAFAKTGAETKGLITGLREAESAGFDLKTQFAFLPPELARCAEQAANLNIKNKQLAIAFDEASSGAEELNRQLSLIDDDAGRAAAAFELATAKIVATAGVQVRAIDNIADAYERLAAARALADAGPVGALAEFALNPAQRAALRYLSTSGRPEGFQPS